MSESNGTGWKLLNIAMGLVISIVMGIGIYTMNTLNEVQLRVARLEGGNDMKWFAKRVDTLELNVKSEMRDLKDEILRLRAVNSQLLLKSKER